MRWVIGIFILLDVAYQLFIAANTVLGWIYYDIMHYGTLLVITVIYAVIKKDKLMGLFSIYLGFCLTNVLLQVKLPKQEYIETSSLDYTSFGHLAIIILLTFIIYKKWGN
jgi:hypothetical protein